MLTAMMRMGMAEKMTRVSSQPWMKALIRDAEKIVMKNTNIPIFSPMPSCIFVRSSEIRVAKSPVW